jgi:hypothetical protein
MIHYGCEQQKIGLNHTFFLPMVKKIASAQGRYRSQEIFILLFMLNNNKKETGARLPGFSSYLALRRFFDHREEK